MPKQLKTAKLSIQGMHCVSCVGGIEASVQEMEGVEKISVNFATSEALVQFDPEKISLKSVIEQVQRQGYVAELVGKEKKASPDPTFRRFFIALLFSLPLLLPMVGFHFSGWVQAALATVVQLYCGAPFYRGSFYALLAGSANMDLLIALGTTAAWGFSLAVLIFQMEQPLYFESSALIITLVLMGRWLETKAQGRASEAISKLLKLAPKTVQVERKGHLVVIPIDKVKVGDLFIVSPGENVAVDGEVVEGQSSVNEALLTGESIPVFKEPGKQLFAATTNGSGLLKVRATKVGKDTVLANIIRLVDEAQHSKAPIQRLADLVSSYFVPAVVAVSMITFLGWLFFSQDSSVALINAVAVLVIACPCALGLATPTVIVVASGKAATMGIFFRQAAALEQAEKLTHLLLDKTGTLTQGTPVVIDILCFGRIKEEDLLSLAYSLEQGSKHPLSGAILSYATSCNSALQKVQNMHAIAGRGIRGEIAGKRYTIGSLAFAENEGVTLPKKRLLPFEKQGKTLSLVWSEGQLLGGFAIADQLRSNSKKAVGLLREMGIITSMLTGDRATTAEAVAKEAGIENTYAEVLPEQKANTVQALKDAGHCVGMVGDGINDAPALATADVGFAIGAGSDIAVESADITLIKHDLMGVIRAIKLSKATLRKIRQNLFFAFIYNSLGVPLAAFGYLNPIVAAAAMALSSVSVITNALLLRTQEVE